MKPLTASFNFPDAFLWGSVPEESFLNEKTDFSLIYRLKENHINAVRIDIPWDRCEPLKGSFDEPFIESVRSLLSRIRGENLDPFVFLDAARNPGWQNLDSAGKGDPSDDYNFSVHLADALFPYTKYFGLICPRGNLFSRGVLNERMAVLKDITDHIHGLSAAVKTGLILPEDFGKQNNWLRYIRYDFLKDAETDFIGITAEKRAIDELNSLFGSKRIPVLFISDELKRTLPDEKAVVLSDRLYTVWRFYQAGWPILGLFSETETGTNRAESYLYEYFCSQNAFKISTEMEYLPEKWKQFLSD